MCSPWCVGVEQLGEAMAGAGLGTCPQAGAAVQGGHSPELLPGWILAAPVPQCSSALRSTSCAGSPELCSPALPSVTGQQAGGAAGLGCISLALLKHRRSLQVWQENRTDPDFGLSRIGEGGSFK